MHMWNAKILQNGFIMMDDLSKWKIQLIWWKDLVRDALKGW